MATGLIALLDDVAALAKVAAASIDDTAAAAAKAGAKAAGVVVDDAAVTPRYVTGFAAARELPIVGKIALGSLKNKLLFLLPGALALSLFAPWAITPLLILGGLYLCYEGAEKLYEAVVPHPAKLAGDPSAEADPVAFEKTMVAGAIRTDFILSAEIMAITLATVAEQGFWARAVVLAVVGIGITVAVYGVVALIVKADDAGVALTKTGSGVLRGVGRGLVVGMPVFLKLLGWVGTLAMLWVGGGIILHAAAGYGFAGPEHGIAHAAEVAGAAVGPIGSVVQWLVNAGGGLLVGLVLGGIIVAVMHMVPRKH